ncbi:MAG: hypothetical protein HRU70_02115 [Phycisphaeraceae bacterium]|nr:MAG: hypothetical protein HRU70_02115 [Phycisphaeraceae bacterium]
MLVRFTGGDGKDVWVSPLHVKVVREKTGIFGKKKGTEIVVQMPGGVSGGGVHVEGEPEEVARVISEAFPTIIPYLPDDDRASGRGGVPGSGGD